MPVSVKVGGAWKQATAVFNKVGGVWKTAADMPVKIGGVWKTGILESGAYESIATLTGTGSAQELTFSSIPSTYKALQIRVLFNGTAGTSNMRMRFNGVTTSTYSMHMVRGSGTAISGGSDVGVTEISDVALFNSGYSGVYMGSAIINILDYASTSKTKTVHAISGLNLNALDVEDIRFVTGLWSSTDAINSITLRLGAGQSFTTTTRIALYGIKGA